MMCEEANCRITCHYFPVKQGEESIAAILDKLNQQGGGLKEDFESFSRVSVRRLGRLLPDARWVQCTYVMSLTLEVVRWIVGAHSKVQAGHRVSYRLPFMDFKKSRASFSKSSFKRAKAFIDADAGFVPTTSKMDLEPKHPFTLALKSLGSFADTSCVTDKTFKIEMLQNGNVLSESLLRNHYINWLKEMHESFDEDAVLDEPVMVVLNSEDEQKKLGISQKVFRVSRKMRLGALKWDASRKPPLRLKFLKGSANHSKDLYVTIEYFLSEGIEEEPGGTRIICRKLGEYKCNGSELIIDKDNASFKIGNSLSFSVDVLSSKKYEEVDENIWKAKLQREKARELSKNPSYIDILRGEDARKLGVNESFPEDATVKAGCKLPNEVIAVVRPQGFVSKTGIGTSKHEQKQLVGELLQMKMEVQYIPCSSLRNGIEYDNEVIYSQIVRGICRNSINGYYVFSTRGSKLEQNFTSTGTYIFTFTLVGGKYEVAPVHVNINIVPADKVARWTLCNHPGDCLKEHPGKDIENVTVRIGEYLGEDLYIRCYDEFGNGMEYAGQLREDGFIKEFSIFSKHNKRLAVNTNFDPKKIKLANDGTGCQITKILFKDGELDDIAPTYKATLRVFFLDMQSAEMSVTVFPGNPHSVVIEDVMQSNGFFKKGIVISKLVLKVGEQGHVNLSGLLKLSGIYNSTAKLQVLSELDEVMLIHNFEIQKRTLRIISEVPVKTSISSLVDLVVEIVDENGNVDKEMDGGYHFLIADCIPNLTFPLKHGKCVVQGLRSPKKVGAWQIQLSHSYHSELQAIISVEVGSFSPTQKPADDEWDMHQLPKDDNVFQIRRVKDHAKDLTKRYEEQGRKAKKLEVEIEKLLQAKKDLGTRKAILEEELQRLENEKENLVSDPNANIITESCQAVQIIHTFEDVIREVKCLGNPPGGHAAATLIEMPAKENYNNGIIGIVALLGSVEDDCLNKICAEFLGPERMGAIVCNNQQVIYSLEKQLSGIDTDKMQSSEKNVYTGRFRAISLDNCKEVDSVEVDSNNQQKLLILNPPRLPSGKTPRGFIGYAVNFIHLNVEQLNIKIGSHQHGLRETLFFNLFKYLQVYNSRQQMVDAMDAIVTGAVSLDGGIIWTDNCFELGSREEPKIRFANVPSEERLGKNLMSPTTDPVRRIAFLHDEIYSKELELAKCKDEFLSLEMKEEDRQLKVEQIKISLLKLYEDLNV
ncbi:hypothetical protein O6H91_07G031900 [Diphasiastrum complanatum]|uniref:Uncharacterized protein n=1 Tax=Diphasiastrum complanatum TaxID=34168 RepID=A0ACC2D3R7_DIPCM|nr:hypothetical protein O6H91_07G031900 [Diphasiastrum complanatum]